MAKRKDTTLDDLLDLASKLPWWLDLCLAATFYLVLHAISTRETAAPTDVAELGNIVITQMITVGATFGQYLLPAIFTLGAIVSAVSRRNRRKLHHQVASKPGTQSLTEMSWREFEMLVGEAFRQCGYRVSETASGADGGVDLVLTKEAENFLVQCKQWRAQKVGVTIVRELYGVMAARAAVGGFVVTSGKCTDQAKRFAEGRNIELIEGRKLVGMIQKAQSTLDAQPHPKVPNCLRCGKAMVQRTAKTGANAGKDFWGCSAFPKCRATQPLLKSKVFRRRSRIV